MRFLKNFIVVHDMAWGNRITCIRKKAIMSIAESISGRAVIAFGSDIVVETVESYKDVIRMMKTEGVI